MASREARGALFSVGPQKFGFVCARARVLTLDILKDGRFCLTFSNAQIGGISEAFPHALLRFGVSVLCLALSDPKSGPIFDPLLCDKPTVWCVGHVIFCARKSTPAVNSSISVSIFPATKMEVADAP